MKKLILIETLLFTACNTQIKKSDMGGFVINTQGVVYVDKSPAKSGQLIQHGQIINTENGTIEIQLKNCGSIRIREFAQISLDSASSSTLKRGTGLFSFDKVDRNSGYNVNTPTAVAGVRGTRFIVSASDNQSEVAVVSGAVEVNKIPIESNLKMIVTRDGNTVVPANFTINEKIEINSMPVIDPLMVNNVIEDSKPEELSDNILELSETYRTIATIDAYDRVKHQADQYIIPVNKSKEKIVLNDGSNIIGYVVTQTKDVILVYDSNKKTFVSVNKFDVTSQEFF